MAVVDPALQYALQQGANRCQVITWGAPTEVAYPGSALGNTPAIDPNSAGGSTPPTYDGIESGDTCTPVFCPNMTDRSLQITGTASGATIALQGSNDGTNFVNLTDVFGNALTGLTVGTLYQINQNCLWIKPVLTGGDGSTDLNVIVAGKKTF